MQETLPHCFWPPEWHPQKAVWLAWPHRPALWQGRYNEVRHLFVEFMLRLSRYVAVRCLVPSQKEGRQCRRLLEKSLAQYPGARLQEICLHTIPTDDIWIRDYGPLWVFVREKEPGLSSLLHTEKKPPFLAPKKSQKLLLDFRFNAWGEKYSSYAKDDSAARAIAKRIRKKLLSLPFVLEGGAVETSGETLLLAHDSILLPSRRLTFSQSALEKKLQCLLGATEALWLKGCLPGDDTDGHVDMLARFASPTRLFVAEAPKGHPAYPSLSSLQKQIKKGWQKKAPARQMIPLPLPEQSYFSGRPLPRSYLNFLITNGAVFVPIYNAPEDKLALDTLRQAFPDRNMEPLYAGNLILEGGAIHCMTMPEFA